MRLLLDTHALLWYAAGDPRLSGQALDAINATDAKSVVSAASLWEMAIKVSIGKLALGETVREFWSRHENAGVDLLPINALESTFVEKMPFHHRDPFDRLIIAQAIVHQLPIVSKDVIFDLYGISRIW